jgi:hypothetical protein
MSASVYGVTPQQTTAITLKASTTTNVNAAVIYGI